MAQQGFDGLAGKRVACVLASGERIEGVLSGFDSQFNVSMTNVSTIERITDDDDEGGSVGRTKKAPSTVGASVVRGTGVLYVEVCD